MHPIFAAKLGDQIFDFQKSRIHMLDVRIKVYRKIRLFSGVRNLWSIERMNGEK